MRLDGGAFVCSSPVGGPLDLDAYTRALRRLAVSVGLDGTRLHDARHAVASTLLGAGCDPETVADQLGHASAAFTMSTYGHSREGAADRAAEALDRALGEARR